MKTATAFKFTVYKDQSNSANRAKIIEVGDTVTLVIRNAMGAATTQDVTVTGVGNGGKDVQWDSSTTGNLRSEDVIRVHAKHQYQCPGPLNYQATITETGGGTVAAINVSTISLNGVAYDVSVAEAGATAGITTAFRDALITKLNTIVGVEGFFSGVITGSAGTQVLTITAKDLKFVWTAITVTAGASVVGPAVV